MGAGSGPATHRRVPRRSTKNWGRNGSLTDKEGNKNRPQNGGGPQRQSGRAWAEICLSCSLLPQVCSYGVSCFATELEERVQKRTTNFQIRSCGNQSPEWFPSTWISERSVRTLFGAGLLAHILVKSCRQCPLHLVMGSPFRPMLTRQCPTAGMFYMPGCQACGASSLSPHSSFPMMSGETPLNDSHLTVDE